jgi:hypothetical protein
VNAALKDVHPRPEIDASADQYTQTILSTREYGVAPEIVFRFQRLSRITSGPDFNTFALRLGRSLELSEDGELIARTLRVPETRLGLPERVSAGSSGAYLMRLLAVSASHRAGGVALPVRGRERGRDPCFASRAGGASPAGDPTELPSS